MLEISCAWHPLVRCSALRPLSRVFPSPQTLRSFDAYRRAHRERNDSSYSRRDCDAEPKAAAPSSPSRNGLLLGPCGCFRHDVRARVVPMERRLSPLHAGVCVSFVTATIGGTASRKVRRVLAAHSHDRDGRAIHPVGYGPFMSTTDQTCRFGRNCLHEPFGHCRPSSARRSSSMRCFVIACAANRRTRSMKCDEMQRPPRSSPSAGSIIKWRRPTICRRSRNLVSGGSFPKE
jgi:hypothetical protein